MCRAEQLEDEILEDQTIDNAIKSSRANEIIEENAKQDQEVSQGSETTETDGGWMTEASRRWITDDGSDQTTPNIRWCTDDASDQSTPNRRWKWCTEHGSEHQAWGAYKFNPEECIPDIKNQLKKIKELEGHTEEKKRKTLCD